MEIPNPVSSLADLREFIREGGLIEAGNQVT